MGLSPFWVALFFGQCGVRKVTSVEVGVEEVLVIALHAKDRGVDDLDIGAVLVNDAVADALDGGLASVGVADDASLADVLAACLELRLDEDDGGALPELILGAEACEDCGQDEGGGDEGHVHREENRGRV